MAAWKYVPSITGGAWRCSECLGWIHENLLDDDLTAPCPTCADKARIAELEAQILDFEHRIEHRIEVGWYWYESEMPEEGMIGPFESRGAALTDAENAIDPESLEYGPIEEVVTLRHYGEVTSAEAKLAKSLKREKAAWNIDPIIPCGDNSCVLLLDADRGGMRTNGGCRCFAWLPPKYRNKLRLAVGKKLAERDAEIERLRASQSELIAAMRDYEMHVDDPAPQRHIDMMRRAEESLEPADD